MTIRNTDLSTPQDKLRTKSIFRFDHTLAFVAPKEEARSVRGENRKNDEQCLEQFIRIIFVATCHEIHVVLYFMVAFILYAAVGDGAKVVFPYLIWILYRALSQQRCPPTRSTFFQPWQTRSPRADVA